jgi:uncharacterized radical SAM superfamily protein
MIKERIEELRARPLEELLEEAWDIRSRKFEPILNVAAPSPKTYRMEHYQNRPHRFVNVSVTGTTCALNCEHCNRQLLHDMIPAKNSEELKELGDKLIENGCEGLLISGGSDKDGRVPLLDQFEGIKYLKDQGLKVIVHTGLVDEETAKMLKEAGVDQVLLDIIGAEETMREVYHLDSKPEVFERTLRMLKQVGLSIAPHIVIGLHFGKILGDYEALRIVSVSEPDVIVLVVLSPFEDTGMEGVEAPPPEEIARLGAITRIINPDTKITFGCASPPKTRLETEELLVKAGINTITYPLDETIDLAHGLGLKTVFKEICCSLL